MLSESQLYQLERFRALNKKYNVGATVEWVDHHVVFRKGAKANCVYLDKETFEFIRRHTHCLSYSSCLGVSARRGAEESNHQITYQK